MVKGKKEIKRKVWRIGEEKVGGVDYWFYKWGMGREKFIWDSMGGGGKSYCC